MGLEETDTKRKMVQRGGGEEFRNTGMSTSDSVVERKIRRNYFSNTKPMQGRRGKGKCVKQGGAMYDRNNKKPPQCKEEGL